KKIAEQLIDTAKKEFLKNLPAYNGVAQSEAELMEILRALKSQNSALSLQIASYRDRIANCEEKMKAAVKANATVRAITGQARQNFDEASPMHVVEPGETLSSISSKYYGTPNSWQKIFEANKSVLGSPENLKVGQELMIP
ncbi:MAG: LysM peptidoglycan-binding domain-containing protein, partial [Puniceicoccales bacterium]|nr:LysM peptidoglycan-binding domain-containing protein [Puniceicoccales bacterium]